jgi:hypothetical protein
VSDVAVHTRALVAGPDAKAARTAVTSVERSATAITLTWLVRLRWGFFLAQAVTVVAARYVLAVDVPIAALAGVVATSGFSNLALDLWSRKRRDPHQSVLGGVFVLDTLLLTALVYFSGGPANPFSVFYLVHVTIAAVALGMRWAGVVVVLSVLSYATLFFERVLGPPPGHVVRAHHRRVVGSDGCVHEQRCDVVEQRRLVSRGSAGGVSRRRSFVREGGRAGDRASLHAVPCARRGAGESQARRLRGRVRESQPDAQPGARLPDAPCQRAAPRRGWSQGAPHVARLRRAEQLGISRKDVAFDELLDFRG